MNPLDMLEAKKLFCSPLIDFKTKLLDCTMRPRTLRGFIFVTNLEEELTTELWRQFDFIIVILETFLQTLLKFPTTSLLRNDKVYSADGRISRAIGEELLSKKCQRLRES